MIGAMKTPAKERRPRMGAAAKARILREYRASNLSQAEFCRRRELGVSTLQYWLRGEREQPEFIELKAPPMAAGEWAVMVEAAGVTMKAAAGADPSWLAALITALRCGA